MAYNDRMWFIGTFCFAAGFLLVFSLVTAGVAVAQNPVPLINQPLVPDAVEPGGAGFILTVNGSGFVSGSVVHWNGGALATTFVSGSQLRASVSASDIAQPGTASVTVVNPGPGGGTSNVVFFAVTSASSSIGFRMSEFGAGQGPTWVSVADFNGDGKVDLAVAACNNNAGEVSILLGKGDGTFQAGVNNFTGMCPSSVAAGDFNGDGKLDLAVANIDSNNVSILLGKGDGTFQAAVNYAVPAGPSSVTIGDFNRDGKLDLAVALFKVNGTATGTEISVLLGNGDGTFQAPMSYTTGKAPISVAVGDFNGDGKLDLAVANYNSNNVSVLLGNGDGTFQAPMSYTTGQVPVLVVVGDFNGDGKLDLAVATSASNNVSVLLGKGDGTFQTAVNYAAGSWPTSVAVGDFNGDGRLDLAVADQVSRSVSLLLGKGDGTFQAPLGYSVGQVPTSVAVGDFNGDGRHDLTVLDSSNGAAAVLLQIRADLNIFPDSLYFGSVQLGGSKTLSTTLTNVGSTALNPGITVAGQDIDEFSPANTCGSSVRAGQSCTISVTFKPTEKGADSANVSISDNRDGSLHQVPLSGAGCVYNSQKHKCLTTLNSPAVQSALSKSATAVVPGSTGSNSIGTRVLDLVDSGRNDPFLANGTQRELLVRFWYPVSSNQACRPAEYTSPKVWNYFSELTELPLPQVTTNSCLDARVANGVHPVVIFTHGYTGTFTDYTFLFEDLASRGYVVASIDHTYEATAVEFPDGRVVKSLLGSHLANSWRTDDQSLSFALSVRLDDLRFVLNELERLNTASDSPFAGKLDLIRVALAGHSLGGLTTWEAVQQDARFKVGILLDPYLANASSGSTETPVMMLVMGREQRSEEECRLWSDLLGPRFSLNLRGAEHLTPSDAVWLAKGTITAGAMGPDKTMAAIRDYVATFLDENLRGKSSDRLLTGPSSNYPDAAVTTREGQICSGSAGK